MVDSEPKHTAAKDLVPEISQHAAHAAYILIRLKSNRNVKPTGLRTGYTVYRSFFQSTGEPPGYIFHQVDIPQCDKCEKEFTVAKAGIPSKAGDEITVLRQSWDRAELESLKRILIEQDLEALQGEGPAAWSTDEQEGKPVHLRQPNGPYMWWEIVEVRVRDNKV